jgi:DNA-directed RNA polymerase specialized sigma24 family protein
MPRLRSEQPTDQRRQVVRKLKTDEVTHLVAQYQAGATVYELAGQFKINRKTVSLHLQRCGIKMRLQGLADEQVAVAAQLYEQGWSLSKLGTRFEVDPETVRSALKRSGVRMREPWERITK